MQRDNRRDRVEAWALARLTLPVRTTNGYVDCTDFNPEVLDRLIVWRLNDPRIPRENRLKGLAMTQRQWTIEARADFADPTKNEAITQAFREAAVHVHAQMALLSDGQRPEVVCFSDDFFEGHEEIRLHEDKLGNAIEQYGDKVGGGGVSQELLDAARDMQPDAPAK